MSAVILGKRTADYVDCVVGDVPLRVVFSNFHNYPTTRDALVILKSPEVLQRQVDFITQLAPKAILEFGIFEGGSSILWSRLAGATYCGIDKRAGNIEIEHWIRRFELSDRVFLNYNVSQCDGPTVRSIVEKCFVREGLDLVIDDASHMYNLSRRSFEIAFPLLRPGGVYLLEDWSWAHNKADYWQKKKFWGDQPALTNLVFDLVMFIGSCPELIEKIEIVGGVSGGFVLIHKSLNYNLEGSLSLDVLIARQDRVFTPL